MYEQWEGFNEVVLREGQLCGRKIDYDPLVMVEWCHKEQKMKLGTRKTNIPSHRSSAPHPFEKLTAFFVCNFPLFL